MMQLLEFQPVDGWAPLCAFLGVNDCPTEPYPHVNAGKSLQFFLGAAEVVVQLRKYLSLDLLRTRTHFLRSLPWSGWFIFTALLIASLALLRCVARC